MCVCVHIYAYANLNLWNSCWIITDGMIHWSILVNPAFQFSPVKWLLQQRRFFSSFSIGIHFIWWYLIVGKSILNRYIDFFYMDKPIRAIIISWLISQNKNIAMIKIGLESVPFRFSGGIIPPDDDDIIFFDDGASLQHELCKPAWVCHLPFYKALTFSARGGLFTVVSPLQVLFTPAPFKLWSINQVAGWSMWLT